MENVLVKCPPCVVCKQQGFVKVTKDGLFRWQNGAKVQEAFPELTSDKREMLISGTHPHCWEKLFNDEEV